ncbi:MarR family winged helix-turn-helix transcriptional regulator [Streptomyces sp. H27-D2]|uniref:MarR family winged helix-turn-helix transcriptional regulator n=1 Tax=Streptomyces sp. H27-D2 TaxID=3046304 RepID=UPI002DB75556|nr:MarR family winged helix-turn-helix transcriptional regulator [Streptomyces sp. H27-D2]MEC4017396.1 MarR family winged helix-turn-helix transcriptional regulator [Streptomyces sp. H27-D2]
MTTDSRDRSVDTIQRELIAFARRSRAIAARMHPELPLVSYTLLAHLDDRQGCRATDLAAHFMLDKSTVSRQIAALERLGLVERRPAPDDHRVQLLHPTPAGTEVLTQAHASRREVFQERLSDWEAADLHRFAGYLLRYNAASEAAGDAAGDSAGDPATVTD